MRVLQVNCVLNNNSSTGKLTGALHTYLLEHGIDSVAVYGYGVGSFDRSVKLCSDYYVKANHLRARLSGLMYGGCEVSTERLKRLIINQKPDIVHLQCINGFFINIYRLIAWLRDQKIPTVLTLHAEFMYTANCGHALECEKWQSGCGSCPIRKKATESMFFDRTAESFQKMQKAFEGFDNDLRVVSVSPWLMERARLSPILKDKQHSCILNGLDTDTFHPHTDFGFAEQFRIPGKKTVLFVLKRFTGKTGDFKGSDRVIRLAEQLRDHGIVFLVTGENCAEYELPDNIIFTGGAVSQRQLAELYSFADVTLIASKKETFSMIVAESLCCGTPVVGFRAGAPEQIALSEYSEFVRQDDIEGLCSATEKWTQNDFSPSIISEKAFAVYAEERMCREYLALYQIFLNERQ